MPVCPAALLFADARFTRKSSTGVSERQTFSNASLKDAADSFCGKCPLRLRNSPLFSRLEFPGYLYQRSVHAQAKQFVSVCRPHRPATVGSRGLDRSAKIREAGY